MLCTIMMMSMSGFPIIAVNIDEVLAVGLNERGIPNYYGTILEITYPEGETQKAIVLDACGACSWIIELIYGFMIKIINMILKVLSIVL